MPISPLVFKDGDFEYMKLCVDLAIYWRGSMFDHRAGIEHFYEEVVAMFASRIRHYATHEMSHAQPAGPGALRILPGWFSNPDPTQDFFTLNLECHATPDVASEQAFDFWASEVDEAGMLRVVLPVSYLDEGPQRLRELARRLIGDLRFHSGNAGFAINWDYKGEYGFWSLRDMRRLGRRFPCIDFPDPNVTLMAIPTGMKRINWLTFVGDALLQRLEEPTQIFAELTSAGVEYETLPHGAMVVAGSAPQTGDVNRQADLAAYRAVGQALAGLRAPDHPAFLVDEDFELDEDRSAEWLAYFDGGSP